MMIQLKMQPNPFRFLLYTEWIMLASCGSLAIVEAFSNHHAPLQHILILVLLGVMGLMLPGGSRSTKLLYTGLEIGLIFYGAAMGYLHILPTLYLIVLIRSCFLFEPPGRWAIALLSFVLFLVHQAQYVRRMIQIVPSIEHHQFWMHLIAETLMFGLGLFLMVVLISTLLRERKTQEELASAHRQLQQFAQQVEDLAAVQERNRIAREIHDALGHSLTALNVQLQTAVKLWKHDPDQAQPFLDQAQRLGVNVMQEVRHSVNALREDARNNTPLEVAITSLVEDFRQGIGIPVTTEIDLRSPLPASTVKALYRIVQEALTNICKHSQATAVEIQVSTTTNHLCLSIRDNGRGFPPERQTAGFGLQSMRQRTIALSGRFYIDSAPGLGCQITVELPLEEVANDSVAPSRRPKPDLSGPEGHVRVGARFTSGGICP